MHWYYCLNHEQVEPEAGCGNMHRMGPYPTREEAERALEQAEERNAEWDAQDEADE